MPNAVIYTRVSTDEQASKGYSLPHQKSVLDLYCNHRGITILKHFQEDYSAKNFDRPTFTEILAYVKIHRKSIDYLYVTRWDRFSRNVEEAYRVIREFREQGIEINAVEQPLDFSQPDSKVMLAVYLVMPEVENDKIGIRTKEGLRRAMKEGCYVAKAPTGFVLTRNEDGKSTLAHDPQKAPIIRKAFLDFAIGKLTSEQVRRKYYNKGLKVSKQTMLNIFRNPVYCGMIKIKPWKKEDEMVVPGLHPGIIDPETFHLVQRILEGKKPKRVHKFTEIDEHLPLRGHLLCQSCGNPLTGSASKGRNGKRHFYYHCQPPCKVRFKAGEVNRIFEELLSEMVITQDVKQLYKDLLKKAFHGEEKGRELRTRRIKTELTKLSTRLESIEVKFLDDIIDAPTYYSMKQRTEEKIGELNQELKGVENVKKNIEEYLKLGISFLHGVDKFYKNSSAEIKKQITGSIFPEKLEFLGKNYRTATIDEFMFLILSNNAPFQRLEIKNPGQNDRESNMAPPAGLEPATP